MDELREYDDISESLPSDSMEYPDNGAIVHQVTESVKELILENSGNLSPSKNPFRSTGISYVPVTVNGQHAKFPLKIKAIPQEIITDIARRTTLQVHPPRKNQGMNKKTKQFEYYTDDRDPAYLDKLSVALVEQRYLFILYGLNQTLSDSSGTVVWEPTDEIQDEERALHVLKEMRYSAGQLMQIKEDIENLTLSDSQRRDREELENFS